MKQYNIINDINESAEIAGFSETVKLHEIYNVYIKQKYSKDYIRLDAIKTCQDWTNTDCKNAIEIIPMLEKYKNLQTRLHKMKKIPDNDKDGYSNIEKYRKHRLHWRFENQYGVLVKTLHENVSIQEAHDYSTLHWAIDLIHDNKKTHKDIMYDIVLGVLDTTTHDDDNNDYIDSIHSYRDIIEKYYKTK